MARVSVSATGLVSIDGRALGKCITIISSDGVIIVDGRAIHGIDMSGLDDGIHAVQWSHGHGELEMTGDQESRPANIAIDNLEFVADQLAAWCSAADAQDNPAPLPWPEQIAEALARIDCAAGDVRAAYLSPGALMEDEYALAERQARTYLKDLESGHLAAPVPPCVQSWAQASGRDPADAALDIVTASERRESALVAIRAARLTGKATLAAMTAADPERPTPEESAALREATELVVASLESLMP